MTSTGSCWCITWQEAKRTHWDDSNKKRWLWEWNGCLFPLATIQHRSPRALGGTNSWDNLTLFCRFCNDEDNREVSQGPIVRAKKMRTKLDGKHWQKQLLQWCDDGGLPD